MEAKLEYLMEQNMVGKKVIWLVQKLVSIRVYETEKVVVAAKDNFVVT